MDDEAIPKALGDYGRLVTVEMHLINEQLQASMGQIVAESAAQGLLNSGATMSRLASEAANTVPVRTQVAMQLMIRCFAAHGVAVNSSNRGIVVERLHQFIENYRVQLRSTVQRTAPFKGPLKHQAAEDQVLRYIDLKANLEKQRIEGEINLVVAASQRQSSDGASPMTGPVFNGPVGLVQLGSNNVGTNHQNLGPDGQKALSDAFAKLIVALEASPQGLSLDVAEVKDVLIEGKNELASP
jgi:hypothetical protein